MFPALKTIYQEQTLWNAYATYLILSPHNTAHLARVVVDHGACLLALCKACDTKLRGHPRPWTIWRRRSWSRSPPSLLSNTFSRMASSPAGCQRPVSQFLSKYSSIWKWPGRWLLAHLLARWPNRLWSKICWSPLHPWQIPGPASISASLTRTPSPVSWAAQWSSHFTSLSSAAHLSLYSSLISATSALLLTCPPTSSPCPCPAARPLQWLINLRNSGGCSHLISRSTSLASCLIYQTYLMMSYMDGRKVMYIMEPLLELLWCTGPAHAQSEKQYNFKEKVWKTTMQYTFNHSILLTWIYMHCLFKILRKNGWFSISTNPASRSVCSLFHMFCKLPFSGPVLISPAVSRHDTLRTGHLRNNLIAIKLTLDWIWNCVSNGKQWNDNKMYFPSHGIYGICRSRPRGSICECCPHPETQT